MGRSRATLPVELPGIETDALPGIMPSQLAFRHISFPFGPAHFLRFRFRVLTASRAIPGALCPDKTVGPRATNPKVGLMINSLPAPESAWCRRHRRSHRGHEKRELLEEVPSCDPVLTGRRDKPRQRWRVLMMWRWRVLMMRCLGLAIPERVVGWESRAAAAHQRTTWC